MHHILNATRPPFFGGADNCLQRILKDSARANAIPQEFKISRVLSNSYNEAGEPTPV
jgi:hypothetical protein